MSDKQYLYRGPLSGVTLAGGRECMLYPNTRVMLPSDSPYVARLVAKGLLVPEAPMDPPQTSAGKRKENV